MTPGSDTGLMTLQDQVFHVKLYIYSLYNQWTGSTCKQLTSDCFWLHKKGICNAIPGLVHRQLVRLLRDAYCSCWQRWIIDLKQIDKPPLHKPSSTSAFGMLLLRTCVLAKCPKPASMSLISRQDIFPRTCNRLQASQMDCSVQMPGITVHVAALNNTGSLHHEWCFQLIVDECIQNKPGLGSHLDTSNMTTPTRLQVLLQASFVWVFCCPETSPCSTHEHTLFMHAVNQH